jgi:hypothetical protein
MKPNEWNYTLPSGEGDCRKLVTLRSKDGMIWVGIRAWSATRTRWLNNGVLETDDVVAWQALPNPSINDGLLESMPAPTLGDHWTT